MRRVVPRRVCLTSCSCEYLKISVSFSFFMIDDYSFGRMVIDGKVYDSVLKIFPDGVRPYWWRKNSHELQLEDISDVFAFRPKLFIIGRGYSSMMVVSEEVKTRLDEENIAYFATDTSTAVDAYNKNCDGKTVCVFHLTC